MKIISALALVWGFFLFFADDLPAQENRNTQFLRRFDRGAVFFEQSRWMDAAAEFRAAQEIAINDEDWAHALYWVILSQLAVADFGSALRDINELERRAPRSVYARDMVYHRGRIYFNQGYFEDALLFFMKYNDSIVHYDDPETAGRKALAFFWMGESLFSMGQFEEAQRFYSWVISRFPQSRKVDVSSFRLELIRQKKREAELLTLLRWSHEEALRASEDFQRRLRTYEHTMFLFQRRLAEFISAGYPIELLPGRPQIEYTGNSIINGNETLDELIVRAMRLENDILMFIRELQLQQGTGGLR